MALLLARVVLEEYLAEVAGVAVLQTQAHLAQADWAGLELSGCGLIR